MPSAFRLLELPTYTNQTQISAPVKRTFWNSVLLLKTQVKCQYPENDLL